MTLILQEAERLADLEVTIAQGIVTFVEVGAALSEIRESRLYRAKFKTFEEYCVGRWQMSASRARQLIAASDVVSSLGSVTNVTLLPSTESQARSLAGVPVDDRADAWREVVATAPKNESGEPKITAAHVASVVNERTSHGDDVAPATTMRGRLRIAEGDTPEAVIRRGIALESELNMTTRDVAVSLHMAPDTYAKLRKIVFLADNPDLNARDARDSKAALARVNAGESVMATFDSVSHIVDATIGKSGNGSIDARAEARLAAVERAVIAIAAACNALEMVDVPAGIPSEKRSEWLNDMEGATSALRDFRNRVKGA